MIKTVLSKLKLKNLLSYVKNITQRWKRLSKKQKLYLLFLLVFALIIETSFYSLQKPKNVGKKALERKENLKRVKKPEYAKGEVLIKLRKKRVLNELEDQRIRVRKEKRLMGVDLDKQAVGFSDLDKKTLPRVLVEIDKKYKIRTVEKVFKGYQSPEKELQKYKRKFSKDIFQGRRKINEKEILKTDLSNIYKITFNKEVPIMTVVNDLVHSVFEIEYAEPNYIFKTQLFPNDPYYLDHYPNNVGSRDPNWNPSYDYQWNLKKINMEEAWNISTGSADVTVAVIDTGVDYTHPELGNCSLREVNNNQCPFISPGYDFADNDSDPVDEFGHGTHVSGLIVANTNNLKGISAINWQTRIMPVKVFNRAGVSYMDWVSEGVYFAVNKGTNVINMSFGNSSPTSLPLTLKEAINNAFEHNVVLVAAAGNFNDDTARGYWPANFTNVISVSAIDETNQKAVYSNYGKVEVTAPGGSLPYNVLSLNAHDPFNPSQYLNLGNLPVGEGYLRLSGTSMAAPHVASLATLLFSQNPTLSNLEVQSLIEYNAVNLNNSSSHGNDKNFGWGIIRADKTLEMVSSGIIPPVAEIYSPIRNEEVNGSYQIIGTASGENFKQYNLYIGIGENPSNWTTKGIVLTNNGRNPVVSNKLGEVDTRFYINDRKITLKLEVIDKKGLKKEDYVFLSIVNNLLMGPNVKVNDGQNIAILPHGVFSQDNYYVVWADNRNISNSYDIYFAKSIDLGNTFSKNKLITTELEEKDAMSPYILTVDKNIYIVFENVSISQDKIFIKKSVDQGETFKTVGILTIPNMVNPDIQGSFKEIKVDQFNNSLYLVWQAGDITNSNTNIYFSRFNLKNNKFEKTKILRKIDRIQRQISLQPSIVTDSDGNIYVVWTEMVEGRYKVLLVKSNDGGEVFSNSYPLFDDYDVENQWYPLLGIDKNQNVIYITFVSQTSTNPVGDVWISKSEDKGNSFSVPRNVSNGKIKSPLKIVYYQSPMAINSLGEVFIAWRDFDGSTYIVHGDSSLSNLSDSLLISPRYPSYSLTISLTTANSKAVFASYDFYENTTNEWEILSRRIEEESSILTPTPTLPVGCIEPGYCDSTTNCGINASCQLINPQDPELGRCCQYITSPVVPTIIPKPTLTLTPTLALGPCPSFQIGSSTLFYGNVYLNDEPAPENLNIRMYSPRRELVGCGEVIKNRKDSIYKFTKVYGDVPPNFSGMKDGEEVSFRVEDYSIKTDPFPAVWHNGLISRVDLHLISSVVCQTSCSSCDADGDGKYIPEKDSSLIWKKIDINCDGEKDIVDVQWCASNCLFP